MEEKKLTIQEEWLLTKKISVKYSTYCKYESVVTKHINPYLKENKIEELTELHIIHYIDHLINVMNLSTSIVNSIQCTLKAIYRYGERTHGLKKLDFNVIKFTQKSKTKEPLTLEKEMIIWQYCLNNKERISLAMSLGLYAGLRIGEICALKWEDIDLENSMISITKTVQRLKSENQEHKTQLYILEPKSTSSIRSVILPDFLTEYLKNTMISITKISLFYQIKKSPRIIQKNFRKICKANDIDATFHTLRHTYATNCIKTNIDVKTLSETLGHANVNITLNRYVHTSLDFKKQQINKIEPPIKP
mgnify:CR=1 FL=1